jgi:hypothetical protein
MLGEGHRMRRAASVIVIMAAFAEIEDAAGLAV